MQNVMRTIHAHIQKCRKVIIIPHQNPDGDAIGSATAFLEYVSALGKPAVIFCVTNLTDKLQFVPNSHHLTSDPVIFDDPQVDTIVVLDSGDLRYAGVDKFVAKHPATIINIDHHNTNEHYGHHNLVIPTAASTTEILYHFFYHNNIKVNQRMATSLLTGLTTDTGNFTNSATSATAMSVGSELIRSGGNLRIVTDGTVKNKSVEALKLWGKVLSRLTTDERTGITYTYMTQADLAEHGVADNESEGIANFLNNLDNTKIAMILKEMPDGRIKGSFRTTRDDVDVSAIAKKLNGGGHKKAAGFALEGDIQTALQKILSLQ